MSGNADSKDFAFESTHDHKGKYGSGPTLKNPKSAIQNSEKAENEHVEKATQIVGAGPSLRNPVEQPENQHIEYRHERRDSIPGTSIFSKESSVADAHHYKISRARTAIGLDAEAPVVEEHKVHEHLAWSTVRMTLREPLAEFFGTFILVLFGNGSVAQVLLSTGETTAPGGDGFGSYQSISWG
jgi:aquaglyceroporin related protein